MKAPPLLYEGERAWRKVSCHDSSFNGDRDFELAVERMEMGGGVITVIHCDDDAKEATDLRHDRPSMAS